MIQKRICELPVPLAALSEVRVGEMFDHLMLPVEGRNVGFKRARIASARPAGGGANVVIEYEDARVIHVALAVGPPLPQLPSVGVAAAASHGGLSWFRCCRTSPVCCPKW